MEPWMDQPAADGGAEALFSRFVCRVSGAPADTVDGLRAERTLALLGDLQATQARVDGAREQVSALLFTAIGAAQEKPLRNKLITLKRDLYNFKAPSAQKLDDALAGADAEAGAAVRAYAADLERAAELRAAVAASYAEEQAGLRRRFAELVGDPDFQKGVLVSSRSLHGNLPRYVQAAQAGQLSGRDEKTERGLLRYFTRMAMKATPFGTFCAIIPGTFGDEGPGYVTFEGDPRQKRSFVRINKLMYGLLVDHLKLRPAVRHALAVERNPTMRVENNRLVFLTAIDGREVFQRVPDNEVLQLIASRFREGTEPTLGDLIDALSADPEIDATPDEAEAYLDKLIEIGFLRFHMGIREQDADWDLPLAALLERIDDPHAQRAAALLRTVRTQTEVYATASVHERPEVIAGMLKLIEDEFEEMGIGQRLRKDMPFYEDATSEAHAKVGLTPGVRRAFGSFEEWCRTTSSLAWPRSEQATMRHFFNDFYGQGARVPLLKFYEDFYREHFKAHVEKENRARAGMGGANLEGYDVNNPFGLQFITDLNSARGRLGEAVRKRWEADPDTRTLDITPEDVEKAFEGVETHSTSPRSMGAFALLAPGEGEDEPSLILNNTSYTSGYGKYFSRFLYMLPFDVQEDVRKANAALAVGDELLAEICGDAQFNANLHPPLLRWEISYPTGESGATEDQIRSSDLLVEEDPEEPQSLAVRHGPSGKRVIPLDLGFLNPRMRPPLYQLLSRFTTPVIFAPTLPETPWPRAQQQPAPAPQPQPGTDTVDEGPADTVDQDTVDQDTVDQDTVARNAAPAPPPPPQAREPRVIFRPRITYRNSLVLARRHWTVPSSLFPQQRADESAADFFVRANRWRAEHGIPETCYLKVMPIPEAPQRPQGAPGAGGPAAPPPAAPPEELPGYEAPVAEMGHDEDEHDHDGDDHEHDEHDEHEGHDHHHEGDDHGHAHAPGGAPAAQPHAHAPGAPPAGGGRPPIPGAWAPGGAKKRTQPSRDYLKPQFMDFGNPLLVGLFGRVAAGLKSYQVIVEERYPDRPALPRHGDSRYVTELVIQVNFPAGTAGAAAGAGELAEAAQ